MVKIEIPSVGDVVLSLKGYTKDRLLRVVAVDQGEEWEPLIFKCKPVIKREADNGNWFSFDRFGFEFPLPEPPKTER